ncbi:MAG: Uma2 family endonuclease [Cyanobacteria bacterium P01_F01_bin.150]
MTSSTVLAQRTDYTPEEYLALEIDAEYRSEYRDGVVVPMTGGTTEHNKIAGNFYAYLHFLLRKRAEEIYFGDVRLWIPGYRQYTYPDVMVVADAPTYHGQGTTTVTNPSLILEVLSKSTQDYDRGTKFTYYRSIPEMREYILVDQYQCFVERFFKDLQGRWVLTEYQSLNKTLNLESLGLSMDLEDLYDGVAIAPNNP